MKSINLHFRSLLKSHCKTKISIIVSGWWYKYQYSDKKNIYIKVKNKKTMQKKNTLKKKQQNGYISKVDSAIHS